MAIDPRGLRTFLAVCRAGSISAAARDLNISQPAVSVTIAQLETAVSATLFSRARAGITLTAAGVALKRRAEAMEALLRASEREITLMANQVAGPLVIGGTPGALASLIPSAVTTLRATFPKFELQILERADQTLNELLRSERIDFAVVTTGIEVLPDELAEEGLLRDPFGLIVGRENEHLPGRIALAEVSAYPWVLPDVIGGFRRQVDALFLATHTPTPSNVIRCDSLLTTKSIVRSSNYVTILPRQVAASELSIGVLREIEIEGADMLRSVGIRVLRDREPSAAAGALLNAMGATSYT